MHKEEKPDIVITGTGDKGISANYSFELPKDFKKNPTDEGSVQVEVEFDWDYIKEKLCEMDFDKMLEFHNFLESI